MDEVIRYDRGAFSSKPRRTAQGFLRVRANLARTGVLVYKNPDGSERRELRLAEEVFKEDSLGAYEDAPVSEYHPAELVTTDNVGAYQRGICKSARQDGKFVTGELLIQHSDTIGAVEAGRLKEVSAGYICQLEPKSGVHEGQRYDAIQRGPYVINHLALLPPGRGRSGAEVAVRLDGGQDVGVELDQPPQKPRQKEPTVMETAKIRIDGIEYEVEKSAAPHIERALKGLEEKAGEAVKRADKAEGALSAAEKAQTEFKTRIDGLDAEIEKGIAEKIELVGAARAVMGDECKLDGLSPHEIRVAVVSHQDEKFDPTGKSEEYVTGCFEQIVKTVTQQKADAEDSKKKIAEGLDPTKSRQDEKKTVAEAADKYNEDAQAAWQEPLSHSKNSK